MKSIVLFLAVILVAACSSDDSNRIQEQDQDRLVGNWMLTEMLLFPVGETESEVPEWYAFDDGSIYRFESDNSFTLNTCSGSYETSGDLIILNYSCGNSGTVTVEYIVNFESGNLILTPNTSSCDEAGFCALKLQKID